MESHNTDRRDIPWLWVGWLVYLLTFTILLSGVELRRRRDAALADAYAKAYAVADGRWRTAAQNSTRTRSWVDTQRSLEANRQGDSLGRLEDVLAKIFPVGPPEPIDDGYAKSWPDPTRACIWHLGVNDDGTVAYVNTKPLSPLQSPPAPHALVRWTDAAREIWIGSDTISLGPVLWAALLVASLSRPRHALRLSHAQFAVALLCFTAWLAAPRFALTSKGFRIGPVITAGILMLFIASVALLRHYLPKRPPKPGVCAGCGYNLTGNLSGVCPECGRGRDAAAAATT